MIDKQYIMGYSISSNGSVRYDDKGYFKEDGLKNRVIDNIFKVILDPQNQINLTQPITTNRIKKVAERSLAGQAAKEMSPFRPTSRFNMQIQNMVGKKVIGNVATAIKSFFALSNVYNEGFKRIHDAIMSGDYTLARQLLDRYTFMKDGARITLANINMDVFDDEFFSNPNIPSDLIDDIKSLIAFQDNLDDESMLLGELLNCATDFISENY